MEKEKIKMQAEPTGLDTAGLDTAGPGTSSPGTSSPGTAGPGTAGPGTAGPGTAGPGTAGPGTTDLGTTDKEGNGSLKRPAEEEAKTDAATGKMASNEEGRSSKKLRIDPTALVIPAPATDAADPVQPPADLSEGGAAVLKIQDESRAKDDDVDEDTLKKKTSLGDQPTLLQRSTSGDSEGRHSVVGGAGQSDTPDDDDSDSERPLDLASMNAFEYERVVSSNPAALRRYEQYRRSDLKNTKVKRVLQALNPALAKVNEPYVIAVKGLAKMFVGDVTEMAIRVRKERGEKGALQPAHLREAYRRLRLNGVFPSLQERSVSFS